MSSISGPLDIDRGVEDRGGKTKADCLAVRGSSPGGSGVVRPREGLRPRIGGEAMLREWLAISSSVGISKVGIGNESGGGSP